MKLPFSNNTVRLAEYPQILGEVMKHFIMLLGLTILTYGCAEDPESNQTKEKTDFADDQFYWDDKTEPYKEIIVKGANQVYQNNSRCQSLDPSSAYISSSKGSKSDPVFYVTCARGAETFNVFFSKSDVQESADLSPEPHIERNKAIELCEEYVKENSVLPETTEFSRILGLSVKEHGNGRSSVFSTFSAKNKLNEEQSFNVRCSVDPNGLIEGNINPAS